MYSTYGIAARVKRLRKKQRLTQDTLAKRAGLLASRISDIERKQRGAKYTLAELLAVLDVLEVPVGRFLGDREPKDGWEAEVGAGLRSLSPRDYAVVEERISTLKARHESVANGPRRELSISTCSVSCPCHE